MAISESCGRGAIKASFVLPLLSVEAQGESSFRNITLIPDTTGIPCPGPSCLLGNSEAGAYWSGALWESAGSSDWSCCFYRSVSLPTGCQGFDEEDLLMAAWQGDAIEGLSPDGVSYAPLGHDMEVHPSSGEAQEETDESASSRRARQAAAVATRFSSLSSGKSSSWLSACTVAHTGMSTDGSFSARLRMGHP